MSVKWIVRVWSSALIIIRISLKIWGASFQANLTYNKNKLVYKDEPDYPTIWKSETGKPYSRLTGYIFGRTVPEPGGDR